VIRFTLLAAIHVGMCAAAAATPTGAALVAQHGSTQCTARTAAPLRHLGRPALPLLHSRRPQMQQLGGQLPHAVQMRLSLLGMHAGACIVAVGVAGRFVLAAKVLMTVWCYE
jgi:hypothetical protein